MLRRCFYRTCRPFSVEMPGHREVAGDEGDLLAVLRSQLLNGGERRAATFTFEIEKFDKVTSLSGAELRR